MNAAWKDGAYAKKLAVLQRIRERAGGNLEIPQICVLGDQGSGKSSLLSSIVPGLRGVLPTGRGTVTRCPTVVHVKPGDIEKVSFAKQSFQLDIREQKDAAKKALLDLQHKYLEKANNDVTRGTKTSDEEDPDEVDSDEVEPEDDVKLPVCAKEIMLTYEGPNVVDLVLVDLPGLIHTTPGAGMVEAMARGYIKQPSTLIVIIREADLDEERAAAVKLASEADPNKERTLQVLTKCDSFSTGGKDEVLRLVSKQPDNSNGDTSLAVHLTCCDPEGMSEEEYFKQCGFNKYRNIGSQDLAKRRLPHLLVQRIQGCKASLLQQIMDKQREAREKLADLGREPQDSEKICLDFCEHIGNAVNMQEILTPLLPRFTDVKISEAWTNDRHVSNEFEPSFYQGLGSFKRCVKDLASEFINPGATKVCDEIAIILGSMPQRLFQNYPVPSKEFKDLFTNYWRSATKEMISKLQKAVGDKVKAESMFATTNDHYLQALYLKELFFPGSVVEDLARAVEVSHLEEEVSGKAYIRPADEKVEVLKPVFDAVIESRFLYLEKAKSTEFQKMKLHAAVEAYWKVSRKRVSDTIMQSIRDIVICDGWETFLFRLPGSAKFKATCKESAKTVQLRKKYLKLESDMEGCLTEVDNL